MCRSCSVASDKARRYRTDALATPALLSAETRTAAPLALTMTLDVSTCAAAAGTTEADGWLWLCARTGDAATAPSRAAMTSTAALMVVRGGGPVGCRACT